MFVIRYRRHERLKGHTIIIINKFMKNLLLKKSTAFLASLAMATSMIAAPLALADNDHNNGRGKDDDRFEEKMERERLGSTLEVHINNNGEVLVRGAKVTAITSSSLTATNTWGAAALSWTVNTDANTTFIRRSGGQSSLGEISVGDVISFNGTLVTTAPAFTVQARVVKDFSIQARNASLKGTVQSLIASSSQFVLATQNMGNVNIVINGNTQIKKGDALAVFTDIAIGATVSVTGVLNTQTNVLTATQVKINVPNPPKTTVQGTVKSIASTTIPTTFVLTVGGIDYKVRVAADTSVLNVFWLRANLSAFQVGNIVRVYGTVNADATIDATVIRNISIR